MNADDYRLLLTTCGAILLILAPFGGFFRAVRRLRTKQLSSTAPGFAAAVVAADAVAGLAGFFSQPVALLAVLLAVLWLLAALASNGLVRRGLARAAARETAAVPPSP